MVLVDVSNGDVIDKLTILEIKMEKINDPSDLKHVRRERRCVYDTAEPILRQRYIYAYYIHLKDCNTLLWDLENQVRRADITNEFFIQCARSIFEYNTRRAFLKRQINTITSSELVEVKQHHC